MVPALRLPDSNRSWSTQCHNGVSLPWTSPAFCPPWAVAVMFLAWRSPYKILGVVAIAALLMLIAWAIMVWPAYWD